MKNIDEDQEGLNIYRVRELLEKTYIRTDRRNENPYTINKKETKMIVKNVRRRNVLKNQETSIAVTTDTTLQFKSFTNHENGRLGSYDRDSTISKEQTTDIYV